MKKLKKVPRFKNDDEVAKFWASHDSVDYVDWSTSKRAVFPNLMPTTDQRRRNGVPLREWLGEELKDPEFKRHYDESSAKYKVKNQLGKRMRPKST